MVHYFSTSLHFVVVVVIVLLYKGTFLPSKMHKYKFLIHLMYLEHHLMN